MKNEPLDFGKLLELAEAYHKVYEEYEKPDKKIEEVKKPSVILGVGEYNEYRAQLAVMETKIKKEKERRDKLSAELKQREWDIINYLPLSNTWFVTNAGEYAMGYYNDTWGGSHYVLKFIKNPEIKELNQIKDPVYN